MKQTEETGKLNLLRYNKENFGNFFENCGEKIDACITCAFDKNGNPINMSYNGIDDKKVLENRRFLANQIESSLDCMVATWQQHTVNFTEVKSSDGGRGMYNRNDAYVGYDGMYTKSSNLWLWTFHADCCPVLMYCSDQNIVAAVHSGWKGTVGEISGKMATYLINSENCKPENMYVFIGPSIEFRNFEARDDIISLVKKMSFDTSDFYVNKNNGTYLLDSKGLIKQQLLNTGIPSRNITVSNLCTIERSDMFFSYRRDKTPYRNISMIRLR